MPVTLGPLAEESGLADALPAGGERMFEPQDLSGRYGRVIKAEPLNYARPRRRRRGDVVGGAYIAAMAAFPIGLGACLVAVAAESTRHGSALPAELLFPYTMISKLVIGRLAFPAMLVAISQYPLYAAALGAAKEMGRFRRMLICLIAVHALAALACVLAPKLKFT